MKSRDNCLHNTLTSRLNSGPCPLAAEKLSLAGVIVESFPGALVFLGLGSERRKLSTIDELIDAPDWLAHQRAPPAGRRRSPSHANAKCEVAPATGARSGLPADQGAHLVLIVRVRRRLAAAKASSARSIAALRDALLQRRAYRRTASYPPP